MEVRDIFKVTSVGFVPSLLDFRHAQKENNRVSQGQMNLHRGAMKMGRADWSKNLEGATLGYNRNAEAYLSQEMQREYTY